jgi:hypothetical protein
VQKRRDRAYRKVRYLLFEKNITSRPVTDSSSLTQPAIGDIYSIAGAFLPEFTK